MPQTLLEKPFRITNASGDLIRGDFRVLAGPGSRPTVIICHGFTAFKDWGPFPYLGRRFAEHGFGSITFNFSHNGIGDNLRKFTEFDRFSRNTIGKELEDLRAVVDAVQNGQLGAGDSAARFIGVVGHSRGGAVALLGASEDRRIRALSGWGTVATVYRYTQHQKDLWQRQGYLPVSIRSAKTKLRFGLSVLEDLESNRGRYDLENAMRHLEVPVLLVHGKTDVSVRPEEPLRLYEASQKSRTELVFIDHAGHTFGAKHPYRGNHPIIDHVIDMTANWFSLHLQEKV